MDQDKAEMWQARLRSGQHTQTTGSLENTANTLDVRSGYRKIGHCCLGVLCVMAVEAGVIERRENAHGHVQYGNEETGEWNSGALPKAVLEWSGIKNIFGQLPSGYLLSDLNDGQGKTFLEIADVIESDWESL